MNKRNIAAVGIGLAGIIALFLIFISHRDRTNRERGRARNNREYRNALEERGAAIIRESHDREAKDYAPTDLRNMRERIRKSSLSKERKDALEAEVNKAIEASERIDQDSRRTLREIEEDRERSRKDREIAEREGKRREEEDPTKLRFVVDVAEQSILPLEPLVVNMHLINEGDREEKFNTVLDPNGGYLNAYVSKAENDHFAEKYLSLFHEDVRYAEAGTLRLSRGERMSFQTDLPLELGYDLVNNKVMPGKYKVKVALTVDAAVPRKLEAETIVVEVGVPKDEDVLRKIIEANLWGLIGTRGLYRTARKVDGFRKDLDETEKLCRLYPNSPYSRHLRIGFVIWGCRLGEMKTGYSEMERLAWNNTLDTMIGSVLASDRPSDWRRAEVLLLLHQFMVGLPGARIKYGDLLGMFRQLCPSDVRGR